MTNYQEAMHKFIDDEIIPATDPTTGGVLPNWRPRPLTSDLRVIWEAEAKQAYYDPSTVSVTVMDQELDRYSDQLNKWLEAENAANPAPTPNPSPFAYQLGEGIYAATSASIQGKKPGDTMTWEGKLYHLVVNGTAFVQLAKWYDDAAFAKYEAGQ